LQLNNKQNKQSNLHFTGVSDKEILRSHKLHQTVWSSAIGREELDGQLEVSRAPQHDDGPQASPIKVRLAGCKLAGSQLPLPLAPSKCACKLISDACRLATFSLALVVITSD